MGGGGRGSGGKFKFSPNIHGHYGSVGKRGNSHVRNMPGGVSGAKKFFDNITEGFISEEPIQNNKGIIRTLNDGTSITFRPSSSTDGTPAIDINGGTTLKKQKIHFVD